MWMRACLYQAFQEKAGDKKEGRSLLSLDAAGAAPVGGRRGLKGEGPKGGEGVEDGEDVKDLLQRRYWEL